MFYWYFRNKVELFDVMVEVIMLECYGVLLLELGEVWDVWFVENVCSFCCVLFVYCDGVCLYVGIWLCVLYFSLIECKIVLFGEVGFKLDEVVDVMVVIGCFVVGWVLEE